MGKSLGKGGERSRRRLGDHRGSRPSQRYSAAAARPPCLLPTGSTWALPSDPRSWLTRHREVDARSLKVSIASCDAVHTVGVGGSERTIPTSFERGIALQLQPRLVQVSYHCSRFLLALDERWSAVSTPHLSSCCFYSFVVVTVIVAVVAVNMVVMR